MPSIGSSSGYGYRKLYATSGRQKTTVYQDWQARRLKRQQAEERLESLQAVSAGIANAKNALKEGQDAILYDQITARVKAEAEARLKEARRSLDITV